MVSSEQIRHTNKVGHQSWTVGALLMSVVALIMTRVGNWFPRDLSYDDVVQTVGVSTSAFLAVLYFVRWYYTTYVLQREYEFVDFSVSPRRLMTDLQELACLFHQDKVDLLRRVISLKQNQLLAFWGSDMDIIDGVIMKTLMDMKCRTMILNFKDAVWVENVESWMDRMEETSNPIHVIVRNLGALIASLGFTSAVPGSDALDEDKSLMLRFRTLLAEKVYLMKKAATKDPTRPLVFYLSGLERLACIGKGDEQSTGGSNKYLARYLEHFVNICDRASPVIVVAGMSDTFWLQHWLKCPAARQQCWSFHVTPIASEFLIQHAPQLPSSGSVPFPKALLKDPSISKRIFRTWGTHSREITRILRLLYSCDDDLSAARLTQYLDTLTHHEVENFLLAWHLYQQQQASTANGDGDEDESTVDVDVDAFDDADDQDPTARATFHQQYPESKGNGVTLAETHQSDDDIPAFDASSLDKSCLKSLLRCSWSSECNDELRLLFRLAKDPHGRLPLRYLCYSTSNERGQFRTMLRLLQRQVLQVTQAQPPSLTGGETSLPVGAVEHVLALRRPVELIALRTLFHMSRTPCGK